MELNELEDLRDYSELDLLYKLIEIAKRSTKRTEQFIKGNKTAGVDVRQSMQDIRLLAEIIRESIQNKKSKKEIKNIKYKDEIIPMTKLEKIIVDKKERLQKEEELINRIENFRIQKKKKQAI